MLSGTDGRGDEGYGRKVFGPKDRPGGLSHSNRDCWDGVDWGVVWAGVEGRGFCGNDYGSEFAARDCGRRCGGGEHDRVVSLVSHLAQLASRALAATVADELGGPPRLDAAGPGLEDMTRLAMGSYDIWRDILATNTEHIERALSAYIQKLEH